MTEVLYKQSWKLDEEPHLNCVFLLPPVPLSFQIIVDDDDSKVWSLYDAGPRSIRCPLIFLPPVSGTADVFFQQILALTGWGYRVIAVSILSCVKVNVLVLVALIRGWIMKMNFLVLTKENP